MNHMHMAWAMELNRDWVKFSSLSRSRWKEVEGLPVSQTLFPTRVLRALAASNIQTIGDLLRVDPSSLGAESFGARSVKEIFEGVRWLLRPHPGRGDQRPPTPVQREELHRKNKTLRIYRLYLNLGTLEAAGRKIGVTKEGVRLIIKQGVEREWLEGVKIKQQREKISHD